MDLSTELILTDNLRISLDISVRINSLDGFLLLFHFTFAFLCFVFLKSLPTPSLTQQVYLIFLPPMKKENYGPFIYPNHPTLTPFPLM